MRSKALLFGLNYEHVPDLRLDGCAQDVQNMAQLLAASYGIPCVECVDAQSTTAAAMVQALYALAEDSHNLDLAWIHYSGHGISVIDTGQSDERDGRDECLVPSDFQTAGPIRDDYLNTILASFNPRTRVVCIFDCCHSGTMCDMKYSWSKGRKKRVENKHAALGGSVVTLSGCRDDQTAADAYNVLGDGKWTGAMTACLYRALVANPDLIHNVFELAERVSALLKSGGFKQRVRLCSSFDLSAAPSLL